MVRASAPEHGADLPTTSGLQVAPRADPQGTQQDGGPAGPIWVPRAPLGPSVSRTAGMPRRGTAAVVHMSTPAVSAAFSSRVSSATSLATPAGSGGGRGSDGSGEGLVTGRP